MGGWELFAIALGLSADAFAVAVCKGLSLEKIKKRNLITVGLYFGGFQAAMPLIGFWLGSSFQELITNIDHWIAFVLLAIIGLNMIKESRECAEKIDGSFVAKAMIPLAVATSIDALAVGITFAFLNVKIISAVSFIGVTTFILSAAGLWLGNKFGGRYKAKAELAGGIVLVLMGIKILFEHLGFLG
ncbi:MAG: manganese efflux pump [Clostridia bacterium]|nr:manganese efflux pump [Clostridia bacterium]